MKRSMIKPIAICLCMILLVSSSVAAFALTNEKKEEAEQPQTMSTGNTAEEQSNSKDETVYVIAGADGSVQKIIVSDWIKNTLGSNTIRDKSELTDVENVKSDESYTLGSDNTRVWDAQGNDIYYQGNIEKELPVGLSVTYKLDGKTVSPAELAGKSGKVTIRFDYTNQQYEYVEIDGQKEKIYVPFAMLTGILLDNDVFTNVEITNGKLINDGSRTAVIGIAFPGLQDNLAISPEKLEIPDYVEITANAKNFKLGMTITLATNELFNEMDADHLDSISDLSGSLGEMTDAMEQLMDGSSQLYDGLSTLLEKSGELVEGIDKLTAGAEALKTGAGDLDTGAAKLQSGAAQLSEGLNTLASNNDSLNGGAKQVFETLLSAANTQLAAAGLDVPALTISNYADVLTGVIASLDKNAVYEKALAAVTAAVEAQRPYIEGQVTAAIRVEVTAQVTTAVREQVTIQVTEAIHQTITEQVIYAATGMDQANYDAAIAAGMIDEETQAAINAAIDEQMQSESIFQMIEDNTTEQMASESVQAMISAKVEEQMQSDTIKKMIATNTELQVQKAISDNMASDEVQAQFAAASEGAKSVISLKTSLDSYNTFYLGLQSYTAGVSQAAAGAGELKAGTDDLKSGTSKLYAGATELYDGILTLKNGTPALVDGITQLRDGAMQLSDGLKEFNEQGVQKLVDAVDGDLTGLTTRLRATIDVSKNYRSFSGIDDNMDGQVKFIYRTDAIES